VQAADFIICACSEVFARHHVGARMSVRYRFWGRRAFPVTGTSKICGSGKKSQGIGDKAQATFPAASAGTIRLESVKHVLEDRNPI
jgi:hypothetical protein